MGEFLYFPIKFVVYLRLLKKKKSFKKINIQGMFLVKLLFHFYICFSSVKFSSVVQSSLTLCDHMNCSTPGLPVHHQLPEFTQIHVH